MRKYLDYPKTIDLFSLLIPDDERDVPFDPSTAIEYRYQVDQRAHRWHYHWLVRLVPAEASACRKELLIRKEFDIGEALGRMIGRCLYVVFVLIAIEGGFGRGANFGCNNGRRLLTLVGADSHRGGMKERRERSVGYRRRMFNVEWTDR